MEGNFRWDTRRVLIMGVLNVTPDSFSDGGRFLDVQRAVHQAQYLAESGADIVDIGGESTRPGAAPVDAGEELRRVMPVIERILAETFPVPISIDTTKSAVAERALAAGVQIVNDISALRFDERMAEVVREAKAGLVLMHMQGTPQMMQLNPHYEDVVSEVRDFLAERVSFGVAHGIEKSQIAVDPGIGFGKTVEHNLQLLARLEALVSLGCPILVGPSRKQFMAKALANDGTKRLGGPAERVWGTAAAVACAVIHGARIVRVHDVAAMVDVVRMIEAIEKSGKGGGGS